MADGLLLALAQVLELVLDGLEIPHVLHKGAGVHQVFVYVVEIGQEDLPPEEEFVQGFRLVVKRLVAVVEGHK